MRKALTGRFRHVRDNAHGSSKSSNCRKGIGYVRQAFLWPGPSSTARDETIQMGPSADTLWLRLHHTISAETGEHLYRAATSLDGENWHWGATWFLPSSDEPPRIGLVSDGRGGIDGRVRLLPCLRRVSPRWVTELPAGPSNPARQWNTA